MTSATITNTVGTEEILDQSKISGTYVKEFASMLDMAKDNETLLKKIAELEGKPFNVTAKFVENGTPKAKALVIDVTNEKDSTPVPKFVHKLIRDLGGLKSERINNGVRLTGPVGSQSLFDCLYYTALETISSQQNSSQALCTTRTRRLARYES